ncbi:hypothetical protein JKP88DRAFT_254791 [Tribonema minus]|uniref:Uncharacterized protein n=1 Tax=Tribonema minus TaxID=303371 RepID=A0A835Z430_9STRA|nr:hypothetical protein JKP88DRAFT_254791 [Tribonema minus]
MGKVGSPQRSASASPAADAPSPPGSGAPGACAFGNGKRFLSSHTPTGVTPLAKSSRLSREAEQGSTGEIEAEGATAAGVPCMYDLAQRQSPFAPALTLLFSDVLKLQPRRIRAGRQLSQRSASTSARRSQRSTSYASGAGASRGGSDMWYCHYDDGVRRVRFSFAGTNFNVRNCCCTQTCSGVMSVTALPHTTCIFCTRTETAGPQLLTARRHALNPPTTLSSTTAVPQHICSTDISWRQSDRAALHLFNTAPAASESHHNMLRDSGGKGGSRKICSLVIRHDAVHSSPAPNANFVYCLAFQQDLT